MKEKAIEQKLFKEAKRRGGKGLKLTCPGFAGMPDRIILMPGGRIYFAEIKSPGEKPRPLQRARHTMLEKLGFKVFVIDDPGQISDIWKEAPE